MVGKVRFEHCCGTTGWFWIYWTGAAAAETGGNTSFWKIILGILQFLPWREEERSIVSLLLMAMLQTWFILNTFSFLSCTLSTTSFSLSSMISTKTTGLTTFSYISSSTCSRRTTSCTTTSWLSLASSLAFLGSETSGFALSSDCSLIEDAGGSSKSLIASMKLLSC